MLRAMVDLAPSDHRSPPLQAIGPDGEPHRAGGLDPSVLDRRLPELYATMVATRGLDEELVNLQRQGELALFASCRGQEAAQVGCAAALRDSDWIFPQYRELGAFLVRGIDPVGVGLMWRGAWNGGLGFLERNVAPISIAIGSHTLHAVGAAMASRWLDDEGVTVCFLGDGATSEGDAHEALNLAAVQHAPCVFFVQNNGWAISTPFSDQCRAATLADKAIGYGMPGVRVDGNDVAACHLVVAAAAARARAGAGPTLIEAVTYRMGPHTTSDDPSRYRSAEEVAAWEALDPIARVRRYLERAGTWDDAIHDDASARAAELRTALRAALFGAPDPDPLELFDHVYADPPPTLLHQRAELEAELRGDG